MSAERRIGQPNIQEAINFIRSEPYLKVLGTSNMPQEMLNETKRIIADEGELVERANELGVTARQSLVNFYEDGGNILIPFSGGYDSTAIAAYTLSMPEVQNRDVQLVTAVTGFTRKGHQNPANQVRLLEQHLQTPIKHYFLNLSPWFSSLVVDTAHQDKQQLGYPGLCAACKVVMEVGMANTAKKLGAVHVSWGYNNFQETLQWPEQHRAQRRAMEEFFNQEMPYLNVGSPLFEVVQLPIDPVLLLGNLGLPVDNKDGEARCWAAGTNPSSIDDERLYKFVTDKIQTLPADLSGVLLSERPEVQSYGDQVLRLKEDKDYMTGHYDESEHMQYRDDAFG